MFGSRRPQVGREVRWGKVAGVEVTYVESAFGKGNPWSRGRPAESVLLIGK
jgi:hypothetical protein